MEYGLGWQQWPNDQSGTWPPWAVGTPIHLPLTVRVTLHTKDTPKQFDSAGEIQILKDVGCLLFFNSFVTGHKK